MELFGSELTFILETVNKTNEKRKLPLIKLLFAFLIERKKSNAYVFYTAYSILAKYGCDSNKQRLKKHIDKLVTLSVLKIAMAAEPVGKHKTPYYFKVKIPKAEGDSNSLVLHTESVVKYKKIETIIATLFPEEKANKLVPKTYYYGNVKPIYIITKKVK